MKIKIDRSLESAIGDEATNDNVEYIIRNLDGIHIIQEMTACNITLMDITAIDGAMDVLLFLSDNDMLEIED